MQTHACLADAVSKILNPEWKWKIANPKPYIKTISAQNEWEW